MFCEKLITPPPPESKDWNFLTYFDLCCHCQSAEQYALCQSSSVLSFFAKIVNKLISLFLLKFFLQLLQVELSKLAKTLRCLGVAGHDVCACRGKHTASDWAGWCSGNVLGCIQQLPLLEIWMYMLKVNVYFFLVSF